MPPTQQPPNPGIAILQNLIKGNQRFASGQSTYPNNTLLHRQNISQTQTPHTVVLSCADSRVAPELVFDQGLGDLFVVRVIGNVAQNKVKASIEYAVIYLGVKLIVVMGHQNCGAMQAAMQNNHYSEHVAAVLNTLKPAIEKAKQQPGNLINNAVKQNAIQVADHLKTKVEIIKNAYHQNQLLIVPAYYNLNTGLVELL